MIGKGVFQLVYNSIFGGFIYFRNEVIGCFIFSAGSAALDLAYLAAGRLDGFWEIELSIWDIAAGALLVKEAGGFIGDFSGFQNHGYESCESFAR
jgi:fructose-1,6-bisphosphatase/inositol monophosphatase family enzyme